jgi:hypothetical protein
MNKPGPTPKKPMHYPNKPKKKGVPAQKNPAAIKSY